MRILHLLAPVNTRWLSWFETWLLKNSIQAHMTTLMCMVANNMDWFMQFDPVMRKRR